MNMIPSSQQMREITELHGALREHFLPTLHINAHGNEKSVCSLS